MFCNTPTVVGLSNQFLGAIHLLEKQKYRGCLLSLSLCVNVRRSVGGLEEQYAVYLFVNGSEINDCVYVSVCRSWASALDYVSIIMDVKFNRATTCSSLA